MKSFNQIGLDTGRRDFFIGLFIIAALIAGSYFLIKQAKPEYSDKPFVQYHTNLERSHGITQGAGIRVSDVRIGEVGKVSLIRPGHIKVDMKIYKEFQPLMIQGSRFIIEQAINLKSVLKGAGFKLKQGDGSQIIVEDSLIPTIERATLASLIEKATITFDNVIESLDEGQILIGIDKVLQTIKSLDEAQILANVDQIMKSINNLVVALSEIKGGEAIIEKAGNILDRIDQSTEQLSKMTLSRMDNATKNIEGTSQRIDDTIKNLEKLTAELSKIDIETLNKTVSNIEKTTESLDLKPVLNNVTGMTESLTELSNATKAHIDDAYVKLNNTENGLIERAKKLDTMMDQSNKILKELQELVSKMNNGKEIKTNVSFDLKGERNE